MRLARFQPYGSFLFVIPIACATPGSRPLPSTPLPGSPEPTVPAERIRDWTFQYLAGVRSYRITRTAVIENLSDSISTRETTSNLTHELLMLERIGDTIQFSIVVDTFATKSKNPAGTGEASAIPIQLAGLLVNDSLQIASDTLTELEKCSPARSAVISDLHTLLIPFPTSIVPGTKWTDSVELDGCQGMIPTIAHVVRSYVVSGETTVNGEPVIVVERSDTIQAHGEGAQQQHRLVLDASGNGKIRYYLNPSNGLIAQIAGAQRVDLTINVSGKLHRFGQNLEQEFILIR